MYVFWPEDTKAVGVKPIKVFQERMAEEQVARAIVITQRGLTAFGRTALQEAAPTFLLEHFTEAELLVNITRHQLVPRHFVLSESEKAELLRKYKLEDSQLPRVLVSDPVSRYYGLSKGQVVKIVRPSETAGRYVTYRLVV
eukprot:TRINITY_DN3731_c0_g1_i1.p1 TRINITY_DN3731_c0_g1~~TRINITY_DN3731_c0_g1_i1.p1  ORF type:complete len:141 (+),score=14.14 TRINITY_DN3731_c0_g1_i1:257-679(+)